MGVCVLNEFDNKIEGHYLPKNNWSTYSVLPWIEKKLLIHNWLGFRNSTICIHRYMEYYDTVNNLWNLVVNERPYLD